MTLGELAKRLPDVRVLGHPDTRLAGLHHDSRRIGRGDLFCALRGDSVDGNTYIPAALERGAAAVLTESLDHVPEGVPTLLVQGARSAMALSAHALFDDPTRGMVTLGLTGTNGKTTGAHILQAIATAAGHDAGRIGTNGWEFGGTSEPLERTTPEAPDLVSLIAKMKAAGAKAVVMEVTSIAVPMRRVDGFRWDGMLFTNLSQDHLDLHGSMNAYFEAKKDFFRMGSRDSVAVANLDDASGIRMLEGIHAKKVTFALDDPGADVTGRIVSATAEGTRIDVAGQWGELTLESPYIGTFNASNVLGCVALALALGWDRNAIAEGVRHAPQVRGRMERLLLEGGVTAVVDYAHTPDALKRALEALRPMTEGRLIVVIGAGGDRDRSKRPQMGRIAAEGADLAVITSDNPRTEDPEAIVAEVAAGASDGAVRIVDRREAIVQALGIAESGDVVAVCGKGHETYQEVNGIKHHFDDREEILKARGRAAC